MGGTAKLKPCPLCGREAEVVDVHEVPGKIGHWRVDCFECGLELRTDYIDEGNPGADKRRMLTLAVRRWNRRKSA